MKKHTLYRFKSLIVLLFLGVFCFAQNSYKTVYEKFNTADGGCDFNASLPIPDEGISEAPVFSAQDKLVLKTSDAKQQYKLLSDSIQDLLKHYKKALPSDYDFYDKEILSNNNYLLREDKKWRLKDSQGKAIGALAFDFILSDTIDLGFVGYINGRANYYDGATGAALLEDTYFHIEITGSKEFIVQGLNGYGLIKDDQFIIQPHLKSLTFWNAKDGAFYSFYDPKNRKTYILLNDLKTVIRKSPLNGDRCIGTDYFFSKTNLYNLKTKKQLLCVEKECQILLVSEKDKRLSLQTGGEAGRLLIDLEGNIISNTLFYRIGPFSEKGFSVSEIREDPNDFRSKAYRGVIDVSGKWVVQPKYHYIRAIKDYWLVNRMDTKEYGLLDASGNEIIPLGPEVVTHVIDDLFLIGIRTSDAEGVSKLINVKTGKTVRENIPYASNHYFIDDCEEKYYILNQDFKKVLVDKEFNVITGPHQEIYFKNGYIYCRDIQPEPAYNEYFRLGCDLKKVPFKVEGQTFVKHRIWSKITDDLEYVYNMQDQGFLIYKNEKVSSFNFNQNMGTPYPKPDRFAGMYAVGTRGVEGYGMFTETGDVLIPLGFLKSIRSVTAGGRFAYLGFKKGETAILTTNGDLVGGQLFKYASFVIPGLFIVSKETESGLINQYGEWLIPLGNHQIASKGGIVQVHSNGKQRWYDVAGNRIK